MKDNTNKSSVKKTQGNIEVSIGDGTITKYDIMTAIAKKNNIYEATVWLNTPIESENNKTPAELMMEGNFETVKSLIDNDQSSS